MTQGTCRLHVHHTHHTNPCPRRLGKFFLLKWKPTQDDDAEAREPSIRRLQPPVIDDFAVCIGFTPPPGFDVGDTASTCTEHAFVPFLIGYFFSFLFRSVRTTPHAILSFSAQQKNPCGEVYAHNKPTNKTPSLFLAFFASCLN